MKFNLDHESVSEIISLLSIYTDQLDSCFYKLQDNLRDVAIRTNYDKLLTALREIIDIYNEDVCSSLREKLIRIWTEEGESLHAFAEDVYMGDESKEAAQKIEDALEDLFLSKKDNELDGLNFSGDPKAEEKDFEEILEHMAAYRAGLQDRIDDNTRTFENKIDDNELYRFLLPVTQAIGTGLLAFCESAEHSLANLEENFTERMKQAKNRVEENKNKKPAPVDFGLGLLSGLGAMGKKQTTSAPSPSAPNNANTPQKENKNDVTSILNALTSFANGSCALVKALEMQDKKLDAYYRQLDYDLKQEYDRLDKHLIGRWNYYEKELAKHHDKLNGRYIRGTLSSAQAMTLYQEGVVRAEQSYQQEYEACWQEYNLFKQQCHQKYAARKAQCDRIKNDIINRQQSGCKALYNKGKQYQQVLSSGYDIENTIASLKADLRSIRSACKSACPRIEPLEKALQAYQSRKDIPLGTTPADTSYDPEAEIDLFGPPVVDNSVLSKHFPVMAIPNQHNDAAREKNLKAVNPLFGDTTQPQGLYTRNCQRCVMAYEARCRGYDVEAKERDLSGSDPYPICDENGWPSVYKDGYDKLEKLNGQTSQELIADIEKRMTSYGDGARAIVRIHRHYQTSGDFSSGHVFIVENINGKINFVDPQSGNVDARRNFFPCDSIYKTCNPACSLFRSPSSCNKCTPTGYSPIPGGFNIDFEIKLHKTLTLTGQTQLKQLSDYKGTQKVEPRYINPAEARILRTDNLEFTSKITDCCKSRSGII